jgi:hypothetical protein
MRLAKLLGWVQRGKAAMAMQTKRADQLALDIQDLQEAIDAGEVAELECGVRPPVENLVLRAPRRHESLSAV